MPSKNTRPERPRRPGAGPALSNRPTTRQVNNSGSIRPVSSGGPNKRPDQKDQRPRKNNAWREIRENIGWGLVIGLPIILVILAILWRATNGFQGKPAETPQPTIAPTATAGSYLAAPPAPAGVNKDRLLFFQAPSTGKAPQLFSANPDGSGPLQLTNTGEFKSTPSWSPDGRQIAFAADGVGVEIVNFDGSGLHTVAYGGFSPVWSPDGTKIAFLKQEPATSGSGPDNTGLVRFLYVTKASSKPGDEKQIAFDALGPNWSPDSKDIAFFSLSNAVMFTISADGGQAVQINTQGLGGWFPTFTPDGNLLFYGANNPAQFVQSLQFGSLTPIPTTTGGVSTTAALTTTVANVSTAVTATVAPTSTPLPPPVVGLYRINRDGSSSKQLVQIENAPAGQKIDTPRFATYIQNSGEAAALVANQPSFNVAPIVAQNGKLAAGLLAGYGHEFPGITIVNLDGSAPLNIISGENGLEPGTRLSPTFSGDGNKVFYWFQSAPNKDKILKVFDIISKKESTVINSGDNFFPVCCGYKR